ncbi:hypothetical protein B0A49_08380 [Cryomyces minteri]|uniref:Uncharacterized protein n=1 Tax=Cryomyces minteri TaxID=331657 RepID=A0A4U0XI82_9PEZI|nr:hypothetical protein B0A49_08380 [Cryomyces minteri]
MSGRPKKLATRATQSSQEDIGTDVDMQDEVEAVDVTRASSRARKPSQKARESEAMGLVNIAEVLGSLQGQMKQLLEANKRTDEANKRSEEANRQLREENKELKDMIKGLKMDIENMKAYSPYWGQSLASQSQPQSYASVAQSVYAAAIALHPSLKERYFDENWKHIPTYIEPTKRKIFKLWEKFYQPCEEDVASDDDLGIPAAYEEASRRQQHYKRRVEAVSER